MERVSLKTIAKSLNISVSTVSRALNDSDEINFETKQKVQELAKSLNYQPNPYANSLRNLKSHTIAVVVPEIANNFFSLAIDGIDEIAQKNGYHMLIYLTRDSFLKEKAIISHLLGGRVDGVLMSVSSHEGDHKHLADLHKRNIPMVFFDKICDELDTPTVTSDDYESAFEATAHLLKKGCKKVALINTSQNLNIGKNRLLGYKNALKQYHLNYQEELVINCGNDNHQNYLDIKTLIGEAKPDGIFASVERIAISTYHACHDLKINIPADVKIISFSNLETAELLNPSLTTITQPAFDMGKKAAQLLFKSLKKDSSLGLPQFEKAVLSSVLIERDSTKTAV